jgi:phage tail sheath protein FI
MVTALGDFTAEYGPGQVSIPGQTSSTVGLGLLAHAEDRGRTALVDLADSGTASTLVTAADALRTNGRWGAAFAPWATIPGIAGGTTRTVPYSAIQAGLIARSDAVGNSPNVAVANQLGKARYATGLTQDAWTEAEREDLNDAGVNVARVIGGVVTTYGYRSLANPVTDALWVQYSGSREVAYIAARAGAVADTFVFSQLDGRGLTIAEFGGQLRAICAEEYDRGALYGETFEDAAEVDVGAGVNTTATIAAGELHAVISVRVSPFAERVEIEIARSAVSVSL